MASNISLNLILCAFKLFDFNWEVSVIFSVYPKYFFVFPKSNPLLVVPLFLLGGGWKSWGSHCVRLVNNYWASRWEPTGDFWQIRFGVLEIRKRVSLWQVGSCRIRPMFSTLWVQIGMSTSPRQNLVKITFLFRQGDPINGDIQTPFTTVICWWRLRVDEEDGEAPEEKVSFLRALDSKWRWLDAETCVGMRGLSEEIKDFWYSEGSHLRPAPFKTASCAAGVWTRYRSVIKMFAFMITEHAKFEFDFARKRQIQTK